MRLVLIVLLTGCANAPTAYFDLVRITDGPYKGEVGTLIGYCSWFENYKVRLDRNRTTCVRIWNMEALK